MKRSIYSLLVSLLAIVMYSCSEDDSLQTADGASDASLEISVVTEGDEDVAISDAEVILFDGEQPLTTYRIDGVQSRLPFAGDPAKNYTLAITKRGYEPYQFQFAYNDLLPKLAGAPLKIRMKPVLELVVETVADDDIYVIDLEGSGTIRIVWPDGTTENLAMPLSTGWEFDAGSGERILLTGDIQKISTFRAFGYNTAITEISGVNHLRSVKSFLPGQLRLQEKLDLSHNKKLEVVDLFNATLPDWFRLPHQHAIREITIALADRPISTREINLLISNLYRNTVRNKIPGGMVALTDSESPSADAIEKIQVLEREYGWRIELNL